MLSFLGRRESRCLWRSPARPGPGCPPHRHAASRRLVSRPRRLPLNPVVAGIQANGDLSRLAGPRACALRSPARHRLAANQATASQCVRRTPVQRADYRALLLASLLLEPCQKPSSRAPTSCVRPPPEWDAFRCLHSPSLLSRSAARAQPGRAPAWLPISNKQLAILLPDAECADVRARQPRPTLRAHRTHAIRLVSPRPAAVTPSLCSVRSPQRSKREGRSCIKGGTLRSQTLSALRICSYWTLRRLPTHPARTPWAIRLHPLRS